MAIGSPVCTVRAIRTIGLQPLVHPLPRRAIVVRDTRPDLGLHPICISQLLIFGHPVVRTVELHIRDTLVSLDASRLLQPLRNIIADLTENSDLSLEDLLVGAGRHLTRDVADEAILGGVVEDLFPEGAWGVEVLRPDLGEKGDGNAGEVAVNFVQVDGAFTELNGLDGAEVVGTGALVVKGHATVTLEVAADVAGAGGVDGELLVVDANTVAVGVWVGEETGLEDRVS